MIFAAGVCAKHADDQGAPPEPEGLLPGRMELFIENKEVSGN